MASINSINKKGTGPLDNLDLTPVAPSAQPARPAAQPSKLDPLFEKLGSVLGSSSQPNAASSATKAQSMSLKQLEALGETPVSQRVRELIARANMLEAMLDTAPVPEQVDVSELFRQILDILRKLDKEVTELYKRINDSKDTAVYKLKPSADSEDGFDKKITIEVR